MWVSAPALRIARFASSTVPVGEDVDIAAVQLHAVSVGAALTIGLRQSCPGRLKLLVDNDGIQRYLF